jgi:hypothetical protein
MKRVFQLLVATLLLIISTAFNAKAQSNCYEEYYKLFIDRGATSVPDGPQDVVVTIREGGKSDCYMARVQVKNNQIVSVDGIILVDGSVKKLGMKLSPKYKDPNNPIVLNTDIVDGMSATLLSDENQQVNFFFIKQLSAKTKAYKKAPPASTFNK